MPTAQRRTLRAPQPLVCLQSLTRESHWMRMRPEGPQPGFSLRAALCKEPVPTCPAVGDQENAGERPQETTLVKPALQAQQCTPTPAHTRVPNLLPSAWDPIPGWGGRPQDCSGASSCALHSSPGFHLCCLKLWKCM